MHQERGQSRGCPICESSKRCGSDDDAPHFFFPFFFCCADDPPPEPPAFSCCLATAAATAAGRPLTRPGWRGTRFAILRSSSRPAPTIGGQGGDREARSVRRRGCDWGKAKGVGLAQEAADAARSAHRQGAPYACRRDGPRTCGDVRVAQAAVVVPQLDAHTPWHKPVAWVRLHLQVWVYEGGT